MKKYIILLILCLAFSYVKAQTILVNSNVISAHEDVTFPFWLDSMSTIEIGTQVVSISALEFNIVPATNGNSLVFSQTKTITSQQTVPNGTTWKITAVLLDSTAVNNSSSSGGGQITISGSGGNMAVALSEESTSTMTMGGAMLYCDSLQEDGYDNWVVPTLEELIFVAGGGGIMPGVRTSNNLFSSTVAEGYGGNFDVIELNGGNLDYFGGTNLIFVRCVRHESISVSGSGSSSGGSNTASTLGSGMPTMLSNESINIMPWNDAILYCDSLSESGFSDWIMPAFDQITYAISGGCVINDARTTEEIWTRSHSFSNSGYAQTVRLSNNNNLGESMYNKRTIVDTDPSYSAKCRCVR